MFQISAQVEYSHSHNRLLCSYFKKNPKKFVSTDLSIHILPHFRWQIKFIQECVQQTVLVWDIVLIYELNLQHLLSIQIIYNMWGCDEYSIMKNNVEMCSIVWERWGKILILYTGLNDMGVGKYGHRRRALLVSWHAFPFLLTVRCNSSLTHFRCLYSEVSSVPLKLHTSNQISSHLFPEALFILAI